MRTKIAWAVMALLVALVAFPAFYAQAMKHLTPAQAAAELNKSIENGKKLFSDPRLGTTGTTCASCHPGGGTTGGNVTVMGMSMAIPTLKGAAATFPTWKMGPGRVITLGEMNNACITMFLKGKALALDDPRHADLAAYVTYLSKGKPIYPQVK